MFIVGGVFCLISSVIGCNSQNKSLKAIAAETEEDYQLSDEQRMIVHNGNDFSLKLFKKIAENEKNKNVFVSTIGMYYALNIINNGASGATQQEICKVLNYDKNDMERINNFCRRLIIGQAITSKDLLFGSSSYMRNATLFVAGKDADINKSFKETLNHNYFAGVINGEIDAERQSTIDKWCSQQTDGLLNSMPIRQGDGNSASLFAANYFNGRWIQEFRKNDTKEEPFYGGTSSTVQMMNKTEYEKIFYYAKLDDFSLLNIPYVGGYNILIILPDKVDGLKPLLQSLEVRMVRSAVRQSRPYTYVYVKLPKFEVNYEFKAGQYLKSLGISKLFTYSSELDKIQSQPMIISDISQRTKVILDEDGTRAAAITSASFATLSEDMNKTEAYFYADHPFAYIIEDPFGNYCFMGTFWGD
jgi:serpin B